MEQCAGLKETVLILRAELFVKDSAPSMESGARWFAHNRQRQKGKNFRKIRKKLDYHISACYIKQYLPEDGLFYACLLSDREAWSRSDQIK